MGIVGVLARTAESYPALLPLIGATTAGALWAARRRRWPAAAACTLLGSGALLLYIGVFEAGAAARPPATPGTALSATPAVGSTPIAALDRDARKRPRFASGTRLHPRFPRDFPLPASFRLESNSGGTTSGTMTARFRFRGEGKAAVEALRALGERNGWQVEVVAPHRLIFRKDERAIEAWFSYPAHSVVLDIPISR